MNGDYSLTEHDVRFSEVHIDSLYPFRHDLGPSLESPLDVGLHSRNSQTDWKRS